LIGRKRSASQSQSLQQIVAFNELHDQKLAITFGEVIHYPRKSRMIKIAEQFGFAFESLTLQLVLGERFFEGDDGADTFIDGLIDRAHPAM
jgi:hypothetical protein